MTALVQRTRGLTLLMSLNWDWIVFVAAIAAGLLAGGFFGSLILESLAQ